MKILLATDSPTGKTGSTAAPPIAKPAPAPAPARSPLELLADEALAVKTALDAAHKAVHDAYNTLRASKLPGLNDAWLNGARGCLATALQHTGVHLQCLNQKIENAKTAAAEVPAK